MQQVSAQQPVDSTTYYYSQITRPKTPEDLINGYTFFKKQKEVRLANADTLGAIYDLRMLAIAEFEMGRTYESEKTAVAIIKLLDAASAKTKKAANAYSAVYNHLGIVYRTIDQPQRAITIYEKALAVTTRLNDSIILLNNMANCYKELGQYDKSIKIFEEVYEKNKGREKNLETARALDNLGNVQSKAGIAEGLPNMLEALLVRKEHNDKGQLFTSYKHLSEHYKNNDDTARALKYAILGKEAAALVSTSYKKEALSNLLKISDNKDISEYINITDSIAKATLKKDNKFASIEYNFIKEKERTQAAELAQAEESRLKTMYQVIGLCIFLLAIALYLVLRYRHKNEKIEQVYHTESEISKKVHDEVANDLYRIMAKVQTTSTKNEDFLDDLESVYNKTRDISKKHGIIDLETDYGNLLIDLLHTYKSDQVNVITKNIGSTNWSLLNEQKKKALYRVIQELMTNMHKHSQATLVVITATLSGKKIQLRYSDNGVGGELKKHNGLLNTENRINAVNGTIKFEANKNEGFTAIISI